MILLPGGRVDILVEPDLRGFPNKLASGLRSSAGIASTIGRGLGLAVAAGTGIAAVGLKSVITLGNEYQGNLNELQAVSGATAIQMAKVGQTAKDLGADMTLPATSAADAANAMVELAKGGLSVDEAMQAAKGTLQLAAAAQVDGATAAELQAAALNSFGLEADQAGRVADVLANTANASASSMMDVGNSLKFVAPVSAALKVSIEDTAAAIGLLANQGVKGEQAGTSLRGILASLASPSAAAKEALDALGVSAFDAQGKFVGLRAFTDQLAQAKGRLTDAEFAAAASTAFGNEGYTAANALASEGASSFDEMAASVSRAGGAADVAAAQTKGLGGAWEGFKSQLETAGIEVYEVIAPGLERATRSAADFVAGFTPKIVTGLRTAIAAGELFGPDLGRALASRGGAVLDGAKRLIAPLADGIKDTLNSAINIGIIVFGGFTDVVKETVDAVEPLATGIGDVVESVNRADGPVGALGAGLGLVYDAASGLVGILAPVVALAGGLASTFAALPGPIQAAAAAILLLKVGPAVLGGLKNALSGVKAEAGEAGRQTGLFGRAMGTVLAPVRLVATGIGGAVGVVRQFNDEARVQQGVAAGAGAEVGRLGGAVAAFNTSAIPAIAAARGFRDQTVAIRDGAAGAGQPISAMGAALGTLVERSPALSAMRSAFQDASAGAERFSRTAGLAAAAGSGLRSAASGIVGALGGPWGVALAGASVGLGLLASAQQKSAQKAAENAQGQARFRDALIESDGAVNDHIRNMIRLELIQGKAAPGLKDLGVNMDQAIDAIIKGGPAFDRITGQINTQAEETGTLSGAMQLMGFSSDENASKQIALANVLSALRGQFEGAVGDQKDFADGNSAAGGSLTEASGAGRDFAGAMAVLADNTADADTKSRALKEALDALSGGQLSLEQANARLNEELAGLAELFGVNVDKSKGWGAELLNVDGSINTVTENGRALLDSMDGIGESMASVAQQTFDVARAQGDDMPTALAKAEAAAQSARDAFIAQHEQMGLTEEQAIALADRYGLIPKNVVTLIQSPGMDETQVELILLKHLVDQVPPDKPITVRSISDEAKQKLIDLGFTVRTLPDGSVEITANTQSARERLQAFLDQQATKVIQITYSLPRGGLPYTLGSSGLAAGAVVHPYARGGMERKLTPMRAGIAQIVPPNTWRVVGDRLRDDEFYIPDNNDARSVSIGLEWARRRGFVLARTFADGGMATTTTTKTAAAVAGPPIIQNNHFPPSLDEERVADIVMDRLSWRR